MGFLKTNHKNNKFLYYLKGYLSLFIPNTFYQFSLENLLQKITEKEFNNIKERVNYYNKIEKKIQPSKDWKYLSDLKLSKQG